MDRAIWLVLLMTFTVAQTRAQTADPDRRKPLEQVLKRFDVNEDGRLSRSERQQAREFLRERRESANANAEPSFDPATSGLYQPTPGPWRFERKDLQFQRDDDTTLTVRVTYPTSRDEQTTGEADCPVILFSHGAGGSHRAYTPIIEHWTSHGYVCLQPTHGDSLSLRGETRRNVESLTEYVRSGNLGEHMFTRTDDVKRVLDNFTEIEKQIPQLKDRLDESRIGMGGHSYGAYTTQMIGGLQVRGSDSDKYMDSRPKALLAISPQGTGGLLNESSWDEIELPIMVITGSNDQGRNGEDYQWRLEAWNHLASPLKYLTFIEQATHSFGGIAGKYPGSGPEVPDHVIYVKSASLAFWDSQLKSLDEATRYLESGRMQQITKGRARITRESK